MSRPELLTEALAHIRRLASEGRSSEALDRLTHSLPGPRDRAVEVLRAELLERTGRHGQSLQLLRQLEQFKNLSAAERGACALVLSRIERDAGRIESSRRCLHRSIALAEAAQDRELLCLAQLPLALLLADQAGPEAATTLLAEIRSSATKLGSPHVSAALHLTVGELDAKRGLMTTARRHTQLAQQILNGSPNLILEMWSENNLLAMSIVRSDFERALFHGLRSLRLAEESGASRVTCLVNLGNLCYATGDFQQAIGYFEEAAMALPLAGERGNAMIESIARVRLAQGQIEACSELLDRVEDTIRPEDRSLYVYRHSQLTRTRLLLRRGLANEALESAECVLALAQLAGDHLLSAIGHIAKGEVLQRLGRFGESLAALEIVVRSFPNHPPDIHARYRRRCSLCPALDRPNQQRTAASQSCDASP